MQTNQLIWGDCLEVMDDIPDDSIDMILVDPPFGITVSKWDVVIPYAEFWKQHNRVIKERGAIVIIAAQPFASELIVSNKKHFKYDLIWMKNKSTGYLNAKKMPLRQHELILVFYKKTPTYNPQKTYGHKPVNSYTKKPRRDSIYRETKYANVGGGQTDRYPTSIQKFDVVNNDDPERKHVNQKPLEMLRWLIRTYTNPCDVVLDSCMGSGSTCVAALQEARQFIGIELDYAAYQGAVGRIKKGR